MKKEIHLDIKMEISVEKHMIIDDMCFMLVGLEGKTVNRPD
jgi:hypothetical protein